MAREKKIAEAVVSSMKSEADVSSNKSENDNTKNCYSCCNNCKGIMRVLEPILYVIFNKIMLNQGLKSIIKNFFKSTSKKKQSLLFLNY